MHYISVNNVVMSGIDVADNLQMADLFADCWIWLNLMSRTRIELDFYK